MDSDTNILNVQSFCKAYEGTPAVSDVSFKVNAGEILGVIGPNGAGKTTTMRAISTLIAPSSGSLTVDGLDVRQKPVDVKQRLAYVPDDPQLFPHLTVEEHLAFTAAAYKVQNADEKSNSLLKTFELARKRKVAAKDLSRGMRQKLAICCAYLHDPAALLLDEPMTGLDPPGIRNLKQSIREHAARGAAVIISSHLLAMVEDICTHVLIIDRGKMKFFGSLEEIKAQVRLSEQENGHSSLEDVFFAALDCQMEIRSAIGGSATSTDVESVTAS